jgi:hypothetical protein
MPEPWWTWIIAPDALRAAAILAAVFAFAWWRKRWRIVAHRPGRWIGIHATCVEPPWPVHLELGWIVIDVERRGA